MGLLVSLVLRATPDQLVSLQILVLQARRVYLVQLVDRVSLDRRVSLALLDVQALRALLV